MAEPPGAELPEEILRKMSRRIVAGNARLRANLMAWAEILGALGWKVAIAFPGRDPLLNEPAEKWAAEISPAPMDWVQIHARLTATPPARKMTGTPRLHIWADDRDSGDSKNRIPSSALTRRENEVLDWIRAGKTGPEIAIIISCAPRTVEAHVASICRKFDVHRRTDLILNTESHST